VMILLLAEIEKSLSSKSLVDEPPPLEELGKELLNFAIFGGSKSIRKGNLRSLTSDILSMARCTSDSSFPQLIRSSFERGSFKILATSRL